MVFEYVPKLEDLTSHMTEQRANLWIACLEKVRELAKTTEGATGGGSRSQGYYCSSDSECLVKLKLYLEDGSAKIFLITCYEIGIGRTLEIRTTVEEYDYNLDSFWQEKIGAPNTVIVDDTHYTICEESGPGSMRGFGGAQFKIRFFDGREVTTTNLWYQGKIPPKWRPTLPNNAEFIKEKVNIVNV